MPRKAQVEQPQVLRIQAPSSDTPGYLIRLKRLGTLRKFLSSPTSLSAEEMDDMVEFILDYVTEPADRVKAKELLWGVSQDEFFQIVQSFGGSEESTVPLVRKGK